MPMYVLLGHVSDESAKNMNNYLTLVEQNVARGEAAGVKMHGWYLTQGPYDWVAVVEAPNDDTVLQQAFGIAASGSSRTETMRAFTLDEVRRLVSG